MDDRIVKVWDVKTGRNLQQLKNHSQIINAIAFPPDGSYLASCSYDQTINILGSQGLVMYAYF